MDQILQEQIEYYRARAAEYDQWFLRQGRFDHGPELNARWNAEVAEVEAELERLGARGRVLELASGTGWWTERLVRRADHLTCVDASLETIQINRTRLGAAAARVDYQQADIFQFRPSQRYDVVFFSFWLSHVPPERFDEFWAGVASCLAPDGRVFFVDSLFSESSSAKDHQFAPEQVTMTRKLNDGRSFRVYKLYYQPDELERRLEALGWRGRVRGTATYFLYGDVSRGATRSAK